MKISYNWLQLYFDKNPAGRGKLPKPEKLAEVLTMHSFEVEGIEKRGKDYVFDISILPNRAHDCLSHIGIAKEVGAIMNLKIKNPKHEIRNKFKIKNLKLKIGIQEPNLCKRYIGRFVEGVKIGPSPKWLKEKLEAIGQKSINNIVDATNFVMFETGQPLHAFDADKIYCENYEDRPRDDTARTVLVRKAKKGEKIITLDNQEIELDENILVIADKIDPLAIAGIKGGKKAEVVNDTKNIIFEAANFEQTNIRKTSKKINLRTESSLRFENGISETLAGVSMDRLLDMVLKIAGGKLVAGSDFYPQQAGQYKIGLHPKDVSKILGADIEERKIIDILNRLGFEIKKISPLKNFLKLAKGLIGRPYKYGASVSFDAPNSFDCSSFVSYVFSQSGVRIPRMSVDQYFFGKPVDEKDLRPGDLFFSNSKIGKTHIKSREFMPGLNIKEGIDHCGIYLGKGKAIHASRYNAKGVAIENLKKIKNLRGFRRIIDEKDDLLVVGVPDERLDIRRKEDLVEEVARIYGYEKILPKVPVETIIPPKRNNNNFYAETIGNILVGEGFSEVYNYSFSNIGDVEIQNPIAKDKKFLRKNLLDGLKKNIADNARYVKNIRIFEIGKIFSAIGGETISFAGIANNADFYEIKGVIDEIFKKLGVSNVFYQDHPDKTADVRIGNTSVGIIDHNSWELSFDMLAKMANEEAEYSPISKYPAVNRDVSLFVPLDVRVEEVMNIIENSANELLVDTDLFDVYEDEANERKSLAFHLVFQSHKSTLSEKEINDLMNKIINALDSNNGWAVRKS